MPYGNVTKAEWYFRTLPIVGRNVTIDRIHFGYYTEAPHAKTLRGTFTVPTGKMVLIPGGYAYWRRTVAATTPGLVRWLMEVSFDGGVTEEPVYRLPGVPTEVNDMAVGHVPYLGMFPEGTIINVYTDDASTGGQLEWEGYVPLIIFDVS